MEENKNNHGQKSTYVISKKYFFSVYFIVFLKCSEVIFVGFKKKEQKKEQKKNKIKKGWILKNVDRLRQI